ncbi:MAG: hypothetical protein KJZ54_10410 [Phycisphaerales bacterium]|nr:hypothetical protein [Phycisphaerales bacterium]
MRVRARVESLERRAGLRGPCPACGGAGDPAVVLVEEGAPEPTPRGCARCGRVSCVKRIVLGKEDR